MTTPNAPRSAHTLCSHSNKHTGAAGIIHWQRSDTDFSTTVSLEWDPRRPGWFIDALIGHPGQQHFQFMRFVIDSPTQDTVIDRTFDVDESSLMWHYHRYQNGGSHIQSPKGTLTLKVDWQRNELYGAFTGVVRNIGDDPLMSLSGAFTASRSETALIPDISASPRGPTQDGMSWTEIEQLRAHRPSFYRADDLTGRGPYWGIVGTVGSFPMYGVVGLRVYTQDASAIISKTFRRGDNESGMTYSPRGTYDTHSGDYEFDLYLNPQTGICRGRFETRLPGVVDIVDGTFDIVQLP